MNITLTTKLDNVNWEELSEVFIKAPLSPREPSVIKKTFTNSMFKVMAFDDDKIIGAVRAISDGVSHAVIYDLVLLPEYQKKGIGKQMMNKLLNDSKVKTYMLYSVPGKEKFYEQFGFNTMKTAMARFSNPDKARGHGYIV